MSSSGTHREKCNGYRKRICEAYCQELLQIAPKVTQKALEEHLKMQKRQQKRDRERLEEARRPFEELNEQYVGFNETTGGIELMIGGKKQEKAASTGQSYQRRSIQSCGMSGKAYIPTSSMRTMRRMQGLSMKPIRKRCSLELKSFGKRSCLTMT